MSMQCLVNNEKIEKLRSGFSLLGKRNQDNFLSILQSLLIVKLKADVANKKTSIKEHKRYNYD